jgi:hypothetical protein
MERQEERAMVTADEAARALGITSRAVRRRCAGGLLPGAVSYGSGRRTLWLIPRQAVADAAIRGRLPPGRRPRVKPDV